MMKKSWHCSVCYDTQMSDGERLLLEKLRKGPLKDLSEEQYAIIQKQTDANGIRGLKGSSAQLVYNAIRKIKETVAKYNSNHDDKGRFASGGNGGGIYSLAHANSELSPRMQQQVKDAHTFLDSKKTLDATKMTNAQKIAMAEQMHGSNSPQHLAAVRRFGDAHQTGSGIKHTASNGDNPRNMDSMDIKRPGTVGNPSAEQQMTINHVTSPASSTYIDRPFGGVEFANTWRRAGQPQFTGYVPFSGSSK